MPAVVHCPNRCKLQVPVRKLFESFQCPKCKVTLIVSQEQVDFFQEDRTHILEANLSSDLAEMVSDGVLFLEGSSDEFQTQAQGSQEEISTPDGLLQSSSSENPPKLESDGGAISPPPIPHLAESDLVSAEVQTSGNDAPDLADTSPKKQRPVWQPTGLETDVGEDDLTKKSQVLPKPLEFDGLGESPGKAGPMEEPSSRKTRLERWGESILGNLTDSENPGVIHSLEISWRAYSLAWAMVVIGLFLLSPIVYTMVNWIGKDYHQPLGRWSFFLLFFSSVQFLYAFFLSQIPDWSTTRLVSYLMLTMTVFATFLLSIALLGTSDSGFFRFLQLSVMEKGKICGWLLIMVIGFGMLSYLCGRTTQSWVEDESRRAIL